MEAKVFKKSKLFCSKCGKGQMPEEINNLVFVLYEAEISQSWQVMHKEVLIMRHFKYRAR